MKFSSEGKTDGASASAIVKGFIGEGADAVLYLDSEVSAHTAGMGMHVDSKASAAS